MNEHMYYMGTKMSSKMPRYTLAGCALTSTSFQIPSSSPSHCLTRSCKGTIVTVEHIHDADYVLAKLGLYWMNFYINVVSVGVL